MKIELVFIKVNVKHLQKQITNCDQFDNLNKLEGKMELKIEQFNVIYLYL